MLQDIRNNMKGMVAGVVVTLMIIPLITFGINSILQSSAPDPAVATVNGDDISQGELQREISLQKARLQAQFGDSLPESFISDEKLRMPALEALIAQRLWLQAAKRGDVAVSEQRFDRMLMETPEFQQDGKFSTDLFRYRAANMGYTATGFRQFLMQDVITNQLARGLAESSFVTGAELERTVALQRQARDFYYLTIPIAPIEESVEISDDQVQTYYDEHTDNYSKPEQVVVNYVELALSDIAAGIDIPEEQLRENYEQEIASFEAKPERSAAHILIEPKDDGSEQALLTEIQDRLAAGEDFAELAKEYSDDLGSKSSGGELGYTSGDTFPEAFETALANLAVGEVSKPVKTDAGYHLIKLLDIRNEKPRSFEEEKDRITRALKQDKAKDLFFDQRQQLEDMTYSADDLQDAAAALDLTVKTSEPFGREGGLGIAANPKVVDAAFGDDVLQEGHNSLPIELDSDHVMILHLKEHLPQRTLELAEVKDSIVSQLKREEAEKQLRQLGKTLQQSVRDGKSVEEIANENNYEWQVSLKTQRTEPKVRRELLEHVFSLEKPAEGQPVVSGMVNNNGNYMLVQLTQVQDGDYAALADSERRSLQQRLADIDGRGDYAAVAANLRENADVEINIDLDQED